MHITALNMYPVKSCGGTPLQHADVQRRGIRHDREFMLVDAERRFVSQREEPRLALVKPTRTEAALVLTAPGMEPLTVQPGDGNRSAVTIWRDCVLAADQGNAAAEWFSTYLGGSVRLVRLPEDVVRPVDPVYATAPRDHVSLADGYPLLLISEESLLDLNDRLAEKLPMNRFRPNVVIGGAGVPYAEDRWAEIQIGDMTFQLVKACARCAISTTNQLTAERGAEPLQTLATYRRVPRGVLFGQNLIPTESGRLHLGDRVEVRASKRSELDLVG